MKKSGQAWFEPTAAGAMVALVGLILMFVVIGTAVLTIDIGLAISMYGIGGLFVLMLGWFIKEEKKGR